MSVNNATHKLYQFTYSICSIMVRYTYALRGEAKDAHDEIRLTEEDINIMKGDQLTEHYLCNINAAGEVPVLATVDGTTIIPDSVEITKYLAGFYPALIPSSHQKEIHALLEQLHSINFFSLTYLGKPETQEKAKAFLEQKLGSDISQRYREAIEYKLKRITTKKLDPLKPKNVKANEQKAIALMKEFDENIRNHSTGSCFGFNRPTALDAHLLVFIARMMDKGRNDIIPAGLKQYAAELMESNEWKGVMQGRSTLAPE